MSKGPMPAKEWADAQNRGAMTDEPDVIAQADGYRVLEGGELEEQVDDCRWIRRGTGQVHAALLADVYRRVLEDAEKSVGRVAVEMYRRVGAVDFRLTEITADAIARREAQGERIEALEATARQAASTRTELENETRALADRLAAVEKSHAHETEMKRAGFKNVIHHIGRLQDRASALEAHMPVPGPCPGEDMRDQLEARQQDEAVTVGDVAPESAYAENPKRYCTVEAERLIRRQQARETAREIAEECRRQCGLKALHVSARAAYDSMARWIEREFRGK